MMADRILKDIGKDLAADAMKVRVQSCIFCFFCSGGRLAMFVA